MMWRVHYNGYNGSIEADGEKLILTHSGLPARGGGLVRDQPREIPLQAISGIHLKQASRLTNGWLTFGLGGLEPAALGAGTAASYPNTVMFRRKDNEQFQSLYDWISTAIAYHRAQGIDPATVSFDPPGQTCAERIHATEERNQQRSAQRAEAAAQQRQAEVARLAEAAEAAEAAERRQAMAAELRQARASGHAEGPDALTDWKPSAEAGWYPAPGDERQLRYWDGANWTEHLAPRTARSAQVEQTPTAATSTSPKRVVRRTGRAAARRHQHDREAQSVELMVERLHLEPPRHPLDAQVEVAGETYYAKGVKNVYRELGTPITARGSTIDSVECTLVPNLGTNTTRTQWLS